MARQVLHLHIYKPSMFGGTSNTTACGRVRNDQDFNVADDRSRVTCKFCLNAIVTNAPIMKYEHYQHPAN